MEGPLFINPERLAPPIIGNEDTLQHIERALTLDNKHDFVELVNNSPSEFLNEELSDITGSLFSWNSLKCFAAVLDGETMLTKLPDATLWLSKVHNSLLHYAACHASCYITGLLLQRGFSADVGAVCYVGGQKLTDVLPLGAALSYLRFRLSRFDGKGMYVSSNLVRKLFEEPFRRYLETLRLLAENTRDVKREFFNYLKEGQMVEVAALLLTAKSRVLSSSTVNGEFQSISEMHDFLSNAKRHLSAENDKLVDMEETLVFLEMFDKIGDKLAALLRLDFTHIGFYNCSTLVVESLIEDAGYEVKGKCCSFNSFRGFCSDSDMKVESDVLEKGDECKKAILTTDVFPSWVKEIASRGLEDKLGNTAHLTYPLLSEPLPARNRVSVSPLGSSSAVPVTENMPLLNRLLKKTTPAMGAVKRVLRPL